MPKNLLLFTACALSLSGSLIKSHCSIYDENSPYDLREPLNNVVVNQINLYDCNPADNLLIPSYPLNEPSTPNGKQVPLYPIATNQMHMRNSLPGIVESPRIQQGIVALNDSNREPLLQSQLSPDQPQDLLRLQIQPKHSSGVICEEAHVIGGVCFGVSMLVVVAVLYLMIRYSSI
jgi:hypothetical protein